jgi:hypothetical protein
VLQDAIVDSEHCYGRKYLATRSSIQITKAEITHILQIYHITTLRQPLRHPTGVSVAALCSPARTGRAMSNRRPPSSPPSPRLQVNRGICRFGQYKNPRCPYPPPRASRVSHHPPQVSGLTLAVARGVVRFLISFYSSPSLRCHPSHFARTLPIPLYYRPCLELSVPLLPRVDGSKTHRRRLSSNSGGEWLDTGGS